MKAKDIHNIRKYLRHEKRTHTELQSFARWGMAGAVLSILLALLGACTEPEEEFPVYDQEEQQEQPQDPMTSEEQIPVGDDDDNMF